MNWELIRTLGIFGVEAWFVYLLWDRSFSLRQNKWIKLLIIMSIYIAVSMPLQGGDLQNAFFILCIFMGVTFLGTSDLMARKIGMSIILYALILDIKMLAVRMTWVMMNWNEQHVGWPEYDYIIVVEMCLVSMTYYGLRKIIGQSKAIHAHKIWSLLISIALTTSFIVIMSMVSFSQLNDQGINLFIIGMMGMCLMSIIAIFHIIEEIVKGANEQVQKHALQCELEYYTDMKEGNERTRKLLHDMKNHMGTIGAMLSIDEKQEAIDYIQQVVGALGEEKNIVYCKNQVANALLHNKVKRMTTKHIQYTLQCDLPQEIGLTSMELSSLLGNTIDNAIEACCRIEREDERFISIKIKYLNNQLMYEIENTKVNIIQYEGKRLTTSKKDKIFHGHGVQQVQQIVENHSGIMDVTYDEAFFKVTVIV